MLYIWFQGYVSTVQIVIFVTSPKLIVTTAYVGFTYILNLFCCLSHTFLPIIVSHVGIIIMHINDDIKQPIDNFDLIVKKKCLHYKGFIIL